MDLYSPELERRLLLMSDLEYTVSEKNLALVKTMQMADNRLYHCWSHALDVLVSVLRLGLSDVPRRAHALAAIFYSVVYTPGAPNNAERSAKLMLKMVDGRLRGRDAESVAAASDLIMSTALRSTSTTENTAEYHRNFLDCTLLGLSHECWPTVVQQDYNDCAERLLAGFDLDEVLRNREAHITAMLAKPTVYLGRFYGAQHEWQARLNLRRLLSYKHDFAAVLAQIHRGRNRRENAHNAS